MKIIISILAFGLLSGCAQIKTLVPSFSDPNQSARIVDVRQAVAQVDCSQPQLAQALRIRNHLEWFRLYSDSKGWRQQDVLALTAPMWETVGDWVTRSREREGSKAYCEIKKRLLEQQSQRAASAVLGRF